jgi:hypothetical protein
MILTKPVNQQKISPPGTAPIFWNKFNSAIGTTISSEIGADVECNEPTFVAGVFGNAIYAPTASHELYKTQYTVPRDGCCEMWFKSDGWDWVGNNPSDGAQHVFYYSWDTPVTGIIFSFDPGGISVYVYDGDGNLLDYFVMSTISDIYRDIWTHLALTWSYTNGRVRLYIDGTMEDEYNSFAVDMDGFTQYLSIGTYWAGSLEIKGAIDNLKIYDFEKTDFSDRFVEG